MDIDKEFIADTIEPIEKILLEHPIARAHFRGELYSRDTRPVRRLALPRANGSELALDAVSAARLLMIPDASIVWVRKVADLALPPGLEIQSTCRFHARLEQSSIVAYHDERSPTERVDALHIGRMVYANDAPRRLATVAFGLMAVNAYRLGFSHITLLAAGDGPSRIGDSDAFIGYCVWPKFGFDAAVVGVELDRFPEWRLRNATSVLDVIATDPQWWLEHGSAREMRFDLRARSRSWSTLIHYLVNSLVGD